MGKKDKVRRDIAGVGPEPRRIGLKPLRGLKDFKISKGDPDIRGWSVRTLSGSEVGRVDDLLVDPEAGEVVMMDVEMRASERHVQLPIRSAQLDAHARRVIVDSGDVQRYANMDDVPRTEDDRSLDRYFEGEREPRREHDRDRDGADDRDERAVRGRELDRDRDGHVSDDVARGVHSRPRDADAIERAQLPPEAQSDADEVVIERRPVIEEVVIRRKVIEE